MIRISKHSKTISTKWRVLFLKSKKCFKGRVEYHPSVDAWTHQNSQIGIKRGNGIQIPGVDKSTAKNPRKREREREREKRAGDECTQQNADIHGHRCWNDWRQAPWNLAWRQEEDHFATSAKYLSSEADSTFGGKAENYDKEYHIDRVLNKDELQNLTLVLKNL